MTTPEYKVVEWSGEPGLMVLAQEWVDECGIDNYSPDAAMKDALDTQNRMDCALFILTHNDKMVGGFSIHVNEMFYTDDLSAVVSYLYVTPKHRGAWLKLIVRARRWAVEMGCKELLISSNEKTVSTDKQWESAGYEKRETVYGRAV